ncbi:hypothetical protein [Nostoc sp. GT001]|uniref:hypothetical protein n=1 Tax=Nostoc sp. GT001 TaxID=3056647 RepID=UPI0025AAC368|nr:hypothetical protein [Nostoc sp. GT001]MDM9580911.1 hypothetical protein [Nostoc sp. GT001]
MENPRQFASLDASDAALHGSLTNRPASAVAAGDPIDFDAINARRRYELNYGLRKFAESAGERNLREAVSRNKHVKARYQRRLLTNKPGYQPLRRKRNVLNCSKGQPSSDVIEAEFAQTRRESPLAQNQRSTPERQPLPSTGSPPPTPSGTSARADSLVEPTATPRPAVIREAIGNTVGGIGQSLPKALPQAAGRLIIPGVGAGLTFAGALIAGQSVQQAATTAAVVTAGSVAGGLIGTAVGGPIGGYVGSMIGGFAGGYLANALFPQQLPSTAARHEQYTPNYQPYIGGQGIGVLYYVFWSMKLGNGTVSNFQSAPIPGPITAFKTTRLSDGRWQVEIFSNDVSTGASVVGNSTTSEPYVTSISRADGQRDTAPDRRGYNPAPADNTPPQYSYSPIGGDNTIPSGLPAAGLNKGKDKQIAPSMPSNNTPNGAPFFPGHGGLAPSYLPNPEHQPSNLGGMLPQMQPLPQRKSLPFAEPEDIPVPRTGLTITPSEGGVVPIGYVEVTAGTVTQSTITVSEGTDAFGNDVSTRDKNTLITSVPSSAPTTAQPIPMSDALSPVPKSRTAPITKTPTELANDGIKTALDQQQKDFNEKLGQLTAIATAIAALTPAIQGIPNAIANNPNVRAANRDDVQGAVCEISQPTGCLGAPIKQAEDAAKANGNKLNDILTGINTAGSAAQLALLDTINGKLGDQLPGGIGGKLSRFADWMHLDRVLNIMILATTVHNGLMLSNDIGQTLLGIISNVLTLIGLKKEDGSAFDIGSVISGSIENLIKGAIGVENYQQMTEAWAKANRIYQATNNVINSFLNLSQTILQASELIAAYTGKIGNALRKGGIILESAYGWMNPQPKFNRVTQTLESLQNGASTIQMVTQAPLDVVNAVTESTTAATEFVKAVKEDDKPVNKATPIPEPDELKAKESQSKTDSQPLNFDFSDLFDGED